MKLLTKEQQESCENTKICYICKEKFEINISKIKNHFHYTWEYKGAAHSICKLKYSVPKKFL